MAVERRTLEVLNCHSAKGGPLLGQGLGVAERRRRPLSDSHVFGLEVVAEPVTGEAHRGAILDEGRQCPVIALSLRLLLTTLGGGELLTAARAPSAARLRPQFP